MIICLQNRELFLLINVNNIGIKCNRHLIRNENSKSN